MNTNSLGNLGKRHFSSLIVSALVIIVLVIVCIVIIRFSLNVNIKGQQALDRIEESANHLSRSLIDQETGQRGYILTKNVTFLEPFEHGVNEYSKSSKELMKRTKEFPALRLELLKVLDKGDNWQEHYGFSLVAMVRKGEQPSVQLLIEAKQAIDDFRHETVIFTAKIEKQRNEVRNKMRQRINNTLISLAVIIVGIILMNLLITFQLLQSIIKPIIVLSNCVKSYTEHDFSKGIPDYRKKDELFDLIKNVDLMRTELSKSISSLESKVNYDELTGLYNRRYFNKFILEQWEEAKKRSENITLILFDIDHYKNFNDTYGHLAGDECLRTISKCLKSSDLDRLDFVARYGGEEFAVLLLNRSEKEARTIAEHIRKSILALKIPHKGSQTNQYVTISLGMSMIIPTDDLTPNNLILMADEALYKSKQNGRNQLTVK